MCKFCPWCQILSIYVTNVTIRNDALLNLFVSMTHACMIVLLAPLALWFDEMRALITFMSVVYYIHDFNVYWKDIGINQFANGLTMMLHHILSIATLIIGHCIEENTHATTIGFWFTEFSNGPLYYVQFQILNGLKPSTRALWVEMGSFIVLRLMLYPCLHFQSWFVQFCVSIVWMASLYWAVRLAMQILKRYQIMAKNRYQLLATATIMITPAINTKTTVT